MIESPCSILKGVGSKVSDKLKLLGINTVQDILFHLPLRYEDRTSVKKINSLKTDDTALIEGVVVDGKINYGGRRSFVFTIEDDTGSLKLRLFYFGQSQVQQLSKKGLKIRCFGSVKMIGRSLEIVHPEYKIISGDEPEPVEKALTPVYSTVNGLSQKVMRKLVCQALERIKPHKQEIELLAKDILDELKLPTVFSALQAVHQLPVGFDANDFINRLAFEELLAHQLSLRKVRQDQRLNNAYKLSPSKKLLPAFLENLSFHLTAAQQRVIAEMTQDFSVAHPMLRLVQGDVGSGKTVVAAAAVLTAIESGAQAAMMAPTELLAEQHFRNFSSWFDVLGVRVEWLSGSVRGKARKAALQNIQDGTAQLIVGTHALFQEEVRYKKLGLVVIDEQHRFGVHQRLAFYEKGKNNDVVPHQLVMTATPIPRTLTMTAYADLDCSVIDELPPGRSPVVTIVVDNERREEIIEKAKHHCESRQQVYWVCPLIDESEVLQCQAAEKTHEFLSQSLPEIEIGLVHGRMNASEKEKVMSAFKRGELSVLVATTVIEVGVDVPNATLMIIENPERMGLSQLHQLRGRVGRGQKQSYCVLLYQKPLAQIARERLNIIRETQDGFEIARKDLEIRGPGEVLGTRQTGLTNFRIADLLRDQLLIPKAQRAAAIILSHYPGVTESIVSRWIVQNSNYIEV